MSPAGRVGPRAVGRRITFDAVPGPVREWISEQFGAVRVVTEHVGGMSPGCATTLATARGTEVFVKAVGPELNEQTPELFRQEIAVLSRLGEVPYRPSLLAAYDDSAWVGLALEHVPGRYPNLAAVADFVAVASAVELQIAELTPAPAGIEVPPLAGSVRRWLRRWTEMSKEPDRFLPPWVVDHFDELVPRLSRLPSELSEGSLCHFDIRDDNLLIRPNGDAVILDWGMARRGPTWMDQVLLAAQAPTAAGAQAWLHRWVPPDAQEVVTSLLVAVAGSQAWNAQQPRKPSLPSLPEFCREDANTLFAIARLRLVPE